MVVLYINHLSKCIIGLICIYTVCKCESFVKKLCILIYVLVQTNLCICWIRHEKACLYQLAVDRPSASFAHVQLILGVPIDE